MADDWVRARVWLHKDPKVVSMADYLAADRSFMNWLTDPVRRTCKESAYEHVTRNVTCHVTKSALVTVWGVARVRGYRENDDLILPHCDIDAIDEVADIPCFGEAMEHVGWAKGEEREDGIWCVRFPNYFEEEVSPAERHKERNAERQRKFREEQRRRKEMVDASGNTAGSVTPRNVTVTPREEESRDKTDATHLAASAATPTLFPEDEKAPKKPRKKTAWPEIPAELNTPAFLPEWDRWLTYLGEMNKRRPSIAAEHLKILAGMGERVAVAAIRHSIRRGYNEPFEPDGKGCENGRSGAGLGPGSRVREPGKFAGIEDNARVAPLANGRAEGEAHDARR